MSFREQHVDSVLTQNITQALDPLGHDFESTAIALLLLLFPHRYRILLIRNPIALTAQHADS